MKEREARRAIPLDRTRISILRRVSAADLLQMQRGLVIVTTDDCRCNSAHRLGGLVRRGFASRGHCAIERRRTRAGGWGAAGENMRSRRTAVLGGSGFIGRYVVKRLAARGEVIAVGCRNAEQAKFLKPMGDVGQIVPLNVAIGDEAVLPAFLAGNDALVNCVGILR